MKPQPAWEVSYGVQRLGPLGIDGHHGMSGDVASEHLRLVGLTVPGEGITIEDGAVGRLTVTSWQPYEMDALPDALRTAPDTCHTLSFAFGQTSVLDPIETPIR